MGDCFLCGGGFSWLEVVEVVLLGGTASSEWVEYRPGASRGPIRPRQVSDHLVEYNHLVDIAGTTQCHTETFPNVGRW